MTEAFSQVQRIVLRGSVWPVGRHVVLQFARRSHALRLLHLLKPEYWPTSATTERPQLQVSLGFSSHGLRTPIVPPNVMACFALKAPAFYAGAARRAVSHLGATGDNAPRHWDAAFEFSTLDGVLSLHAESRSVLDGATKKICRMASEADVGFRLLPVARKLASPLAGQAPDPKAQWVHFGYRDGLSRVGIKGWRDPDPARCNAISIHEPGEFLLGHVQDCGANPWIAGPGRQVWPKALQDFFRDGSFGVLHQVRQHVAAFERFVQEQADKHELDIADVKAKLCGRYPDGRSLAVDDPKVPGRDFDYSDDPAGIRCPFGSHMRRMNPRDPAMVEAGRRRALLRRGMPYGMPGAEDVGLHAQFFCASIEDQFEHLVAQWAERVPLGSADTGHARDPLAGAHQPGDGAFHIPRAGLPPLELAGFPAFTRVRGTAYLFYPSLSTLKRMSDSDPWGSVDEDDA